MSNDPAAPLDLDDGMAPPAAPADGDVRAALRAAQQAGDVGRLQALLAQHPELEFTEDPDLLAILAVARAYMQQRDLARACVAEIDAGALSDTAAHADHGLALFVTGETAAAAAVLQDACGRGDAGFEAFMRLGALEVTRENLSAAAEAFEAARQRNPNKAEIISNLGGVKFRLGDYQAAVELYDQALARNPELPQPREMRAKALLALDRADEMIEEAQQTLDKDPSQPARHLYLATVQMQAEHWAQAEATLDAAIDRFPERDDLRRALVNLLQQQKATQRLGLKLKDWAEAREEPDWTWLALNRARIEARFLDAAERSLDEIAETPLADEPSYPVLRAKILVERARADEAVDVLYDAVERFPGNAEARNLLAHTLTSLGRLDEAEGFYDDTAAQNPMAIVRHVEGQDNRADDTEIEQLEKLFGSVRLEPDARARVGFTLASARDKRKEYDRAFEVLNDANALARRRLNYDWRQHRRFTQRQIATITPEVVERLSGLGCDWSNRPIFVVGMPRSGTTLTEQILCSHPDVYGAGELNWVPRLSSLMPKVVQGGRPWPEAVEVLTERNLKSAAKYYLDRVAAQENESPRTVDKLPHNFDNVALIALMFPNAPIVHLDREPRDVAVSNYYQNFAAAHGVMGFAYDLRDIGHMLNDHDRIMQHWHALFPGRIFELNYQRLTADPENTIAELLEFCGLSWDDRVMRFYETQRPVRTASIRQVREGIYTSSTEKWRRYADFLDPLEEVLAEGYKPLDEAEPQARYRGVIAGPTGAV
jgi:tetratricopeptide (TPR) repeat protein